MKNTLTVNSLHHQSIKIVAEKISVVAEASDGVIEAAELNDYPFGLLVQWHPECMPENGDSQKIFEAFISASTKETHA